MNHHDLRSKLTRLCSNYFWTWNPASARVVGRITASEPAAHPLQIASGLDDASLDFLATDAQFVLDVESATAQLDSLFAEPAHPRIAYCSPEFGLSATLPQYAGGLGILAGDHLKSSSDLGIPLAGVGLFYREGVFRQVIEGGNQVEAYHSIEPESVGASDTGVVVAVPFPGREVNARVWRIDVGRVPLLLLDTDVESNAEEDRRITDRVYTGSREHRIEQEMILGVGGARVLAAMGWDIEVYHLNEGHAGFIVLELIDRLNGEITLEDACEQVRDGLVFTTHTPVPEGIDRFQADDIRPYLQVWADRWEVPVEQVWELGEDPDDPAKVNMAALCLRASRTANGVSPLHGEVSRKLFAGVGIGDDIGHVTNGVHARTWTAGHTQELFDATIGPGWADGDPGSWERVGSIDDETLADNRSRSSRNLADLVSRTTGTAIDPDALIVGFARRFAPYKRASLLLRRPDLLAELLGDDSRPVHFVFAGKAHPSDATGKSLVAEIIEAASTDLVNGRITFVPDYDMRIARYLVQGADLWLNNPIRPREASGTSGEKAVLNGSLNCSILDGWWAEMYDGMNGWQIPTSDSPDDETRDNEEATAMLETLAAISTEYHSSTPIFLGRIRHAWKTLGPHVNSSRMLRDYQDRVYHLT